MTCPNCGSEEWKSASLVHKEGSSTSESSSFGVGVSSSGELGVGGMSTTEVQQTELSKLASPPEKYANTVRYLIFVMVTGVLGFIASWWWWLTALCVIGVIAFFRVESKEDDVVSERYNNTRMCTQCGTFYVYEENA
jgi:hypothetical protein